MSAGAILADVAETERESTAGAALTAANEGAALTANDGADSDGAATGVAKVKGSASIGPP